MEHEKLPAREMLLHFAEELQDSSYQRQIVSENYQLRQYSRTPTGASGIAVDLQFSQVAIEWMNTISKNAKLFVWEKILPGIKMYNLLWHYPTPTKTVEKRVIKELVDNRIILRTEVPGIYLLNPTKLWRGTIFGAVEATRRLLFHHRRPSIELIIDLKAPRSAEHTGEETMILMNGNSSKLLT